MNKLRNCCINLDSLRNFLNINKNYNFIKEKTISPNRLIIADNINKIRWEIISYKIFFLLSL